MQVCFPELVARNSQHHGSAGRMPSIARLTHFPEKYWNTTSLTQLAMTTSRQPTLPSGKERLTSSQEASPASLFLLPEKEEERKITATSGLKCCEQLKRSDQLGLLLKTLMESSRWYSPARRLTWDVQTLFSRRITLRERSRNSQSREFALTLNVRDIPSNRLLYRLVPSEHHTAVTEYGLLPTVQTQGLKVCNNEGKTEFANLQLLPTPLSNDGRGGASKNVKQGKIKRPSGQIYTAQLRDLAGCNLLPTPTAQESRGNASRDRGKSNLTDEIAHICKPDGQSSQLNPLFVAEMMGFPTDWTLEPFLSQSGEESP